MLSIGKIGSSKEQQLYYEESVALSREDYYAGAGEAPGEFLGEGSRMLGLSGQANAEQLKRLFAGQDPLTGEQLRSMRGNVQVHGFDLTFSAPKSVSILYALGSPELQANIAAADRFAIKEAISYMERESARVVRGHKATRAERAAGVADTLTTHRAPGFVGIGYVHRVSRLQDPQYHTHFVIGNWALGPDGRWTSLAAEHIYELAKSGGAVHQLAFRAKLSELEPAIEWGPVENGLADVAETIVPGELRKLMSRRREEILEAELEMVDKGFHAGRALRQAMWQQTRNPKDMTAELGQAWSDEIVARASDWLTPEELEVWRTSTVGRQAPGLAVEEVQEHAFGPDGVAAMQNTFGRKDVVIEVANHAPGGLGSLAEIDGAVSLVLDSEEVLAVRTDSKLREQLTTRERVEQERRLFQSVLDGFSAQRAIVDGEVIERTLEEFYREHPDIEVAKFRQQEAVLRAVASDGNGVSIVEALAGSGKTTTAGAMAKVFEAGGYRVFAAGSTGRAVRELERVGFERPSTLSAWELRFEVHGPREAMRRVFGDPSRAVLFVDEIGMADTPLLSGLVPEMSDAGVKVVLIGDSFQLPSVRAGGMPAALSQQLGAYGLTRVIRQSETAEIEALSQLRHGNARAYINYKRGQPVLAHDGEVLGWVARGDEDFVGRPDLEVFTGDEANVIAMRQAVEDFLVMRDRGVELEHQQALDGRPTPFAHAGGMHGIALVTKDNTRRAALNRLVRERLGELGVLSGHMTMGSYDGQELQWAVGDRVIARRNSKGYDLDNGTLGTIVALDERGMTLLDDNGNSRRFERSSPEDLEYVSEHLEHAYALTAHGTQGATLRWAGVVGIPSEFTREWAYTALSRARQLTKVYVVSGFTLAQEARREYATEMAPEADPGKVLDQLAAAMDRRVVEDVATLSRSRKHQLEIDVGDDLDERAHAEFQADLGLYRDNKYRLAGEAFARMRAGEQVGGEKLAEYIELRVYQETIVHAHDSDRMQDAIQAASDWERLGKMIDAIHAKAAGRELDAAQAQSVDTLERARGEITGVYPDPRAILNVKALHEADVRQIEREVRIARAAAIAEHRALKPEWMTVVGSPPTARAVREAWESVVDDLAGHYVDGRAERALREQAVAAQRERDVLAEAGVEAHSDPVAQARAVRREAIARSAALSHEDPEAFTGMVGAQRAWEQAVLDSNPPWLSATLGERPVDPQLAKQWDTLGRQLIGLREVNGITNEVDNGYHVMDFEARDAIVRYRIAAGLVRHAVEPRAPSVEQGYSIGD